MKQTALVTGAAGFIGSHLAEALVRTGTTVVGVDDFNPYYDPAIKRRNLSALEGESRFSLVACDLNTLSDEDLDELVSETDVLFHLAAQAGVRTSWDDFNSYVSRNISLSHRVLESARRALARNSRLKRFVFASTSSVYGEAETLPTSETSEPLPVSPYGVTKLAAERMALLYAANFGVPVTALRLFSVYGPRQRPDMGFNIFFRSILRGEPVSVFGDGEQTRDFTYVSDVVSAMLASADADEVVGKVINAGGGNRVSLMDVLDVIEEIVGHPVERTFGPQMKGDARHTSADITRARELLGYSPAVGLHEGLRAEWEWNRNT